MRVRQLIGAGDRIIAVTLPFAAVGVAANLAWPFVFRRGLGAAGRIAGMVLLAMGVALYGATAQWLDGALARWALARPAGPLCSGRARAWAAQRVPGRHLGRTAHYLTRT